MPLNWTTTDRAATLHGVKMLIYGTAGAGKTSLCATTPRPVVFSAESGLLPLRNLQLPVAEIKTVEELSEAYNWALNSQEAANFDTICIDSISEIAEVVLANAKKQVKDPRQAYGELIEKMTATIRSFRDLPNKHVCMMAKAEPVKDEMSGITRYAPSMPGAKLGPHLPYYFDEVFWLGVNQDQQGQEFRYLQTALDLQHEAKDRSGVLDKVEYPDINNVIAKILGG